MAGSPERTRPRRAGRAAAFPVHAPFGADVPPPGPDVCVRCHGPARPRRWDWSSGECWCCRKVGRALGEGRWDGPPATVIALCRPGDALHAVLRRYKDAPVAVERRHHAAHLGRMVDRFLTGARSPGWWPDGVDAVAGVPSSARHVPSDPPGRAPACPVDQILDATPALAALARVPLGRGTATAGHLRPAAGAFVPVGRVAGRRVVLVEDTWVTGARARSAGAALAAGGATVVAVLVVGRCVDPAASAAGRAWWARNT